MSIYGHTKINIESLKRWANTLSVENINKVDYCGKSIVLNEDSKQVLKNQIHGFVTLINELKAGDDWRTCEGILSPIFYNAFIRINNSSIKIGDYYECLIISSDVQTRKSFDYTSVGSIDIYNGEKEIATIGSKSDLIWTTFYDYFINENEDGSVDQIYENHESVLSIQLFDVENEPEEQLDRLVNELLLQVSMEYGMNFKKYSVDSVLKLIGDDSKHIMQYKPIGYDYLPMMYLNNAINTQDERMSYLSYYQVIEYFFVRLQNYHILNELSQIDTANIDHNKLRKILSNYRKISTERESLNLVLFKSIDVSKLKIWLNSNQKYQSIYCSSAELNIDISKDDKIIISKLAERVYSFRCSIAHAKGDTEEYIAIPGFSNRIIADELPLIKYLAFAVIEKCSGI